MLSADPEKKTRKLFVSDLDGTLLRNNETLSDFTREMLTKFLNEGLDFTIATARSRASVLPILKDLPLRLPIIEINGAFLTDYKTGEHLIINNIDPDIVPGIYNTITAHNCLPFVTTFGDNCDRLYWQEILNDGMRWYFENRTANRDPRLGRIEKIENAFEETVVSFNVIGFREQIEPIAEEMKLRFAGRLENFLFENYYSPGWWWLTIHDQKACKSKAVKTLVEYAGFKLNDLLVFGDNLNDVNMFKAVPYAVAVANASEQIKSLAHEIIGDNESDSVARYIQRCMAD